MRLKLQKISRFTWKEDVTPSVEICRSGFVNRRARISATRTGKTAQPNANISRKGNVAPPWRMAKSRNTNNAFAAAKA